MRSDDERDEEVLRAGGWSRRAAAAITIAGLAVVAGVVVVLTRGDGGRPAANNPAPTPEPTRPIVTYVPRVTGNKVLDVGTWSAISSRLGAPRSHEWFVIASAGLVNDADHAVTVNYPISVTGDGVGRSVTVDVAEVAMDEKVPRPIASDPSGVATIRAHGNVEIWLRLRLACVTPRPSTSPIHNLKISIPLVETSAPATFTMWRLFGVRHGPDQPPAC